MANLNELFKSTKSSSVKENTASSKYNPLQMAKMTKKTENGDISFNTTGNNLLDIFFLTEYFQKNLDKVKIGDSEKEQIFSMFIRDPRFGIGKRDLGRELMKQSRIDSEMVSKAGRFDDLLYNPTNENIAYLHEQVKAGNELAKKWCPRLSSKDSQAAQALAKMWFPNIPPQSAYKAYRKLIKVDTTENKLSRHREEEINFEHVPSLAMIKYFQAFYKKLPEKFGSYIEAVKKGEKKVNIATTNIYDIYKNRNSIDAQMLFDKYPKISGSFLPILDTSGSMQNQYDSIGRATSIAHYLSKCSTYNNNKVVTFSSEPFLIDMGKTRCDRNNRLRSYYGYAEFRPDFNVSNYINEVNSLYTGDCSNTDFGKVIELLGGLDEGPEWFVVLSDMEFDSGSSMRKDSVMKLFKQKGIKSKIVWWCLTDGRSKTVPEVDEHGNVFISGYTPQMLQYLEAGFDGEEFLNKLLAVYSAKVLGTVIDTKEVKSEPKVQMKNAR